MYRDEALLRSLLLRYTSVRRWRIVINIKGKAMSELILRPFGRHGALATAFQTDIWSGYDILTILFSLVMYDLPLIPHNRYHIFHEDNSMTYGYLKQILPYIQ